MNYDSITKDVLYDMYVTQKKSCRTIAQELGVGKTFVNRRLVRFDIPLRKNIDPKAFNEDERKKMYGKPKESHHNWKGGKSHINNILRNRLAWVSRARLILDDYTCGDCGAKSNVVAHHKTPFSKIVDEILNENTHLSLQSNQQRDVVINICENDSRLKDVKNLETLCETCHRNHHTNNPVKVLKYDLLEKRNRSFIRDNHNNMSVSKIALELNIRPYRIIRYMKEAGINFAYENKDWLQKEMEVKRCSEIAKEFNSQQYRCYAKQIREKAFEFGLISYKNHINDTKTS